MYELVIIGGGPGGIAAGVYAARKKIKFILVTEEFGGQSVVSADVQNWIGTKSVSGYDLGKMFEEHLKAQEDTEILENDAVVGVEKQADGTFIVVTREGKRIPAKYILIASGSRRRKLNIPGEKELDGRGVVYCSTCDAPLFKDKVVAVIGGGNAGLEAVVDLFPYASKIFLLERGASLKGDPLTQEKVKASPKVELIFNAQTTQVVGDQFVKGLRYKDLAAAEEKEISLSGVFVEIGAIPNSDFVKGIVTLNPFGEIVVDHKTQQSSDPGIWAVGDVSDVLYKQNNISAGDGVKALLSIYDRLSKESA
jgi:alkyl hydroperoxide reductase subunit AhpF